MLLMDWTVLAESASRKESQEEDDVESKLNAGVEETLKSEDCGSGK